MTKPTQEQADELVKACDRLLKGTAEGFLQQGWLQDIRGIAAALKDLLSAPERHDPHTGPCPTCGFQIVQKAWEPFTLDDDEPDAAPTPAILAGAALLDTLRKPDPILPRGHQHLKDLGWSEEQIEFWQTLLRGEHLTDDFLRHAAK